MIVSQTVYNAMAVTASASYYSPVIGPGADRQAYTSQTNWFLTGNGTSSSVFHLDKSDFTTGGVDHALVIFNFSGANENTPGLGLGIQDYIDFSGFSSSATITQTKWSDIYTGSSVAGHVPIVVDIKDHGHDYVLVLDSNNGGGLVHGVDYWGAG